MIVSAQSLAEWFRLEGSSYALTWVLPAQAAEFFRSMHINDEEVNHRTHYFFDRSFVRIRPGWWGDGGAFETI